MTRSSRVKQYTVLSRWAAVGLAGILMTAAPSWSHAQQPTQQVATELAAAERAYSNLDYSLAVSSADKVLEGRGLPKDALSRATRIAALGNAALGKSEASKQAFVALLAYDPDFKLDAKLGPSFQDPYSEARGFWKAQAKRPGVEATANLKAGSALGTIRVQLRDPTALTAKVVVGYRWAPATEFQLATVSVADAQVELAAGPSGATRLDFFVQAHDARANIVFEDGNSDLPKTAIASVVAAPPENKRSIFASPWFWLGTGVVLAGAGVTTYVLTRPLGDPTSARIRATPFCGAGPCN
jgi:hypothetical protein